MSLLEIHLYFIGIPLLLVAVLSALIWSHKGPHPAAYKLQDKWTHAPILWAASDLDVDVPGGHGGHDTLSIGGGASGTW